MEGGSNLIIKVYLITFYKLFVAKKSKLTQKSLEIYWYGEEPQQLADKKKNKTKNYSLNYNMLITIVK